MGKTILSFLILLLCINLSAAVPVKPSGPEHWSTVITELSAQADRQALHKKAEEFRAGFSKRERAVLDVIEEVIAAQKILDSLDKLNEPAAELFERAKGRCEQLRNPALELWVNTQIGFYYYSYSELVRAFDYFSPASKLLESLSPKEMIMPQEVLKKTAYFFGTIEQRDKALGYVKKAVDITPQGSQEYGSLLNYLGELYLQMGELEQASRYFELTQRAALSNHDSLRYAKALGSLAEVFIARGQPKRAEGLYQQDIALSAALGPPAERNTMYAQLQLSKLYLEQNRPLEAEQLLASAGQYARSKSYLKGFELEIAQMELQVALFLKDEKRELDIRRNLEALDSLVAATDGPEMVSQINWQSQKEQVRWQLEAQQEKLKRTSLLKWTWLLISALLALVLSFSLILYRKRMHYQSTVFQKKLLSFQLDKMNSEKKLAQTHQSLLSYQVYLTEKNAQIRKLESEIQHASHSPRSNNENRISLQQLLQSHLMTDENWNHFKEVFILEKPAYYQYLQTNFPDLTEANLRIILLQKTGLNNSEIAKILGITLDAVKKSKQRLRKKYTDQYEKIFEPSGSQ